VPATVLAERAGWDGSISWFRENVAWAAAAVPTARSGGPADVARRCRAVRSVVPARPDPAAGRQYAAAAGAGDHCGALALHYCQDDPDPHDRGSAAGLVGADLRAGPGAAAADLRQRTGIGRGGKLAAGVAAFTGTLATRIVHLRPRDPESMGDRALDMESNACLMFLSTSVSVYRSRPDPCRQDAHLPGACGRGAACAGIGPARHPHR
jgi:hypothetical protein